MSRHAYSFRLEMRMLPPTQVVLMAPMPPPTPLAAATRTLNLDSSPQQSQYTESGVDTPKREPHGTVHRMVCPLESHASVKVLTHDRSRSRKLSLIHSSPVASMTRTELLPERSKRAAQLLKTAGALQILQDVSSSSTDAGQLQLASRP